jgi:hypothetical protein
MRGHPKEETMSTRKRNHTIGNGRKTTGRAEPQNQLEVRSGLQPGASRAAKPVERELETGIAAILNMRVGCWRPPIYVKDDPAR